jgi:hypothetical protein
MKMGPGHQSKRLVPRGVREIDVEKVKTKYMSPVP